MNFCKLPVIFLAFAVILASLGNAQQDRAGFGIRINQAGLNYFGNWLTNLLQQKLRIPRTIPDISDNEGKTKYSVTNIRSRSFNIGRTSFSTRSPNVFQATISGANFGLSANYRASRKLFFFRLRSSGRVSITAKNIRITQGVRICSDSTGRPQFTPHTCTASIGKLELDFSGSLFSGLLNILSRLFRGRIERLLEKRVLCRFVPEAVTDEGRKRLTNKYRVSVPAFGRTSVNIGLAGCSVATSNSIAVYINGHSYCPAQNPNQRFPFPVPRLPSFSPPQRMCQGILSQYAFNTLVYSLWQKGVLSRTLSESQLLRSFNMNAEKLGVLSAGARPKATDSNSQQIQVTIGFSQTPTVSIGSSGITIEGNLQLSIPNGPGVPDFTLSLNIRIMGSVRANGDRIEGSVSSVSVTATTVTGLEQEFLVVVNELLDAYIPELVTPIINGFVAEGTSIPSFAGFRITRPVIRMKTNALEIAADIRA